MLPMNKKQEILDAAYYYIWKTMSKFADPDGFIEDEWFGEPEEDLFWEYESKLMGAVDKAFNELKKELNEQVES